MVDVSMGKDDRLDKTHVDAQPRDVVVHGVGCRPSVEQDRPRPLPDPAGHDQGDAPAGATETLAREFLRAGLDQVVDFGGNAVGNRRQAITDVVEENEDVGAIQGRELWRFVPQELCAQSLFPSKCALGPPA